MRWEGRPSLREDASYASPREERKVQSDNLLEEGKETLYVLRACCRSIWDEEREAQGADLKTVEEKATNRGREGRGKVSG